MAAQEGEASAARCAADALGGGPSSERKRGGPSASVKASDGPDAMTRSRTLCRERSLTGPRRKECTGEEQRSNVALTAELSFLLQEAPEKLVGADGADEGRRRRKDRGRRKGTRHRPPHKRTGGLDKRKGQNHERPEDGGPDDHA